MFATRNDSPPGRQWLGADGLRLAIAFACTFLLLLPPLYASAADNPETVPDETVPFRVPTLISVPEPELPASPAVAATAVPRLSGRDAIHRLQKLGATLTLDQAGNGTVVSVRMSGFRFTDDDLGLLPSLQKLDRLEIHETRMTDDALKHLPYLQSLRELSISGLELQGNGLVHLARVKGLTSISLTRTCVNDETLRHLVRVAELKNLSISRSSVTDAGLSTLRDIPQLRTLFVFGADLTDEGVQQIAGLSRLEKVSLIRNQRMSDAAVSQLRTALPKAELDIRGPAFLGVAAAPHTSGCKVLALQPNGAAASSGLRIGDVITTLDGRAMSDFAELIGVVNQRLPGDEVRMGVLRQASTLQLTVVLQAWE